jgi:hypothetical protein
VATRHTPTRHRIAALALLGVVAGLAVLPFAPGAGASPPGSSTTTVTVPLTTTTTFPPGSVPPPGVVPLPT